MKCMFAVGALLAACGALPAQPPLPQPGMPQGQPGMPPGAGPGMDRSPGMDPTLGTNRTDSVPARVDDKAFLKRVAADDQMQIELGKLASGKASSDNVRQFGRKIADERQKSDAEVQKLAAKEGVPVASAVDAKHKAKVDKLARLDGPAFDRAFLKEQMRSDRDDLAEFQAEARSGSDDAVKNFATRVLPMMQAQAQTAKDLEESRVPGK